MSPRTPASRVITLLVGLLLALLGIVARLAVLQVAQADELRGRAAEQRVRVVDLPAERGAILDRDRVTLALSVDATDIYADPRYVDDPATLVDSVAGVIGTERLATTPAALVARLSDTATSFVYLARQVPAALGRRVEHLDIRGVGFLPTSRRSYPAGELAAQVLGFVGVDGVGLTGLEHAFDDVLAGSPGHRTLEVAPGGRPILGGIDLGEPAVPGASVVTTLDRDIQFRAQDALERAVEANGARGGMVVVLDPRTGEIYAMTTYPWFDLNDFAAVPQERFRNRPVTDVFEPGSTSKVITAAAALELGLVTPGERFVVPDELQVDDYTIHDAHPHRVLRMTLGDILAESSNVGSATVATRLGADGLLNFLERFGLDEKPGTGFPGETGGIMLPLADWQDVSLATISYGQGIAASLLQMTSVYATIANHGVRVAPRLVAGTVDASGTYVPAPESAHRRVVSRETADVLTSMLAYAVESGTGLNARIAGYQVAGKTGTARIPLPDRAGYYESQYMASFIGFAPAGDPQLVVAVVLDRPATEYGSVAAAPLFREVMGYALAALGIPTAAAVPMPPHALGR